MASVTLTPAADTIMVGQTTQPAATARDSAGQALPGRVVTWTTLTGRNVQIGYSTTMNGSVELLGTYAVGGSPVLDLGYWTTASLTGNSFIGRGLLVSLNDSLPLGEVLTGNVHQRDPASSSWRFRGARYTFGGWQLATGLALADQAVAGTPTATKLIVRPNPYEVGRANIIVYNWGRLAAVSLDLTGVLPVGAKYEIRNVQSLFSAPVVTGTFGGGTVSLPLTGVQPPAPIGMGSSPAPATGVDFNGYVLTVVP